jgi:hypothetical protein
MKVIIKIFTIILIIVEVLFVAICSTELLDFLKCPNAFHVGSEFMIENGGWSYSNNFAFIFFNSIMIITAICLSIFFFKVRKTRRLFLLFLLLFICQIFCFLLL